MRFRKGSKVEVLRKKELPTGEWRCGKIISGNGHTYSVVYEGSFGMRSEALVERVPRNAIRPCPPSVGSVESCSVGDVVEVFDVGSWKVAMSWQDNKWVVIGKGSGSCGAVKSNKPYSLNCYLMDSKFPQFITAIKKQTGNDHLAAQDNTCFQESRIVSSKTLKRLSPYCSSHIEEYTRKMRAVEKEGPTQDADTLCSDADSFYDCGDEEGKCPLSLQEDVAAKIHRLELHAYCRTVEAIYASGPLSWEQEALLTNLRISLNISNDEHLMEIRNLKSVGTGLHLS
ncbi:hypothetical protein SLA2020_444280 [Shorea laevis]